MAAPATHCEDGLSRLEVRDFDRAQAAPRELLAERTPGQQSHSDPCLDQSLLRGQAVRDGRFDFVTRMAGIPELQACFG